MEQGNVEFAQGELLGVDDIRGRVPQGQPQALEHEFAVHPIGKVVRLQALLQQPGVDLSGAWHEAHDGI